MDLRTVMLMLAIGSFLYGLLLVFFQLNKSNSQKVPFWIPAKFLQAAGSFMLYFRTSNYDILTMTANIVLLLGCAYEAWAIRVLSGGFVKRRLHAITSAGIILVCLATIFMSSPYRTGLIFLLQSVIYFISSFSLFSKSGMKSSLRSLLAVCYTVTGLVFLLGAIVGLVFPWYALRLSGNAIFGVIPGASFCIFLVSGFILLMLAKERMICKYRRFKRF